MMRLLAAALVVVLLGAAGTAGGEITSDDVAAARRRAREVSRDLEEAVARFEAAQARELALRDELARVGHDLVVTERDLAAARGAAVATVRTRYMAAGGEALVVLFSGDGLAEVPLVAMYLERAGVANAVAVRRYDALRKVFARQRRDLDTMLAEQRRVVAEIEAVAGFLEEELTRANAEYRTVVDAWEEQERRRLEEERRREEARRAAATSTTTVPPTSTTVPSTTTTVPPTSTTVPSTTTTTVPAQESSATTTTVPGSTTTTLPPEPPPAVDRVCPVDGPVAFTDTWGAPRSGGRTHKGVDMKAARGTPVVAIEDGLVTRLSNSALGGYSIYLAGDSGARYYYAHLDAWADGLSGGQRVTAGDRLGTVGTSGNAPDWIPHLHFQYAPEEEWVNPYPLVDPLCH